MKKKSHFLTNLMNYWRPLKREFIIREIKLDYNDYIRR